MSELMSVDTELTEGLVINRMPREAFNQLCSEHQLNDNQLYLVTGDEFDMFNMRVINVDSPVMANDAVNIDYLSSNYIAQGKISEFSDNTKTYNSAWNQYIDGNGDIFQLVYTDWNIAVLKGSISPSQVSVYWNPSTTEGAKNGYNFVINGDMSTRIPTGAFIKTATSLYAKNEYAGNEVEIKAEREIQYVKIDSLVKKSDIYSKLSGITQTSDINEIATALKELANAMKA